MMVIAPEHGEELARRFVNPGSYIVRGEGALRRSPTDAHTYARVDMRQCTSRLSRAGAARGAGASR